MKDFLELRVKEIIPETADARTYVLENTEGPPPAYQAGQFLTFVLNRAGRELRRSYSLSSAPGVDPDLAVTIKRVVNGEISRYLLDTLRVGDSVRSLYPAGRFTLEIDPANQRDIFLIGAGSGITPLFSLLKKVLQHEPRSRVILIDSNKNPQSALFWKPLQALAVTYPTQFTGVHLFSDPPAEDRHLRTRLKNSLLEELVQKYLTYDPAQARFYICGPLDFMRMVQITLLFMGFDREKIRKENFVIEPLPTVQAVQQTDTAPRRVTINYRQRTFELKVPAHQNILQAALAHHIPLPYSCRAGRCATCVARCTQGRVRMSINEVLTDREVAEGWILTCVAYPETAEVRIDMPFI